MRDIHGNGRNDNHGSSFIAHYLKWKYYAHAHHNLDQMTHEPYRESCLVVWFRPNFGKRCIFYLNSGEGLFVARAWDTRNATGTTALALVTKSQTFRGRLLCDFDVGVLFGSLQIFCSWGCQGRKRGCHGTRLPAIILKALISSRIGLSNGVNYFCAKNDNSPTISISKQILTDVVEIDVRGERLRHRRKTPHGGFSSSAQNDENRFELSLADFKCDWNFSEKVARCLRNVQSFLFDCLNIAVGMISCLYLTHKMNHDAIFIQKVDLSLLQYKMAGSQESRVFSWGWYTSHLARLSLVKKRSTRTADIRDIFSSLSRYFARNRALVKWSSANAAKDSTNLRIDDSSSKLCRMIFSLDTLWSDKRDTGM